MKNFKNCLKKIGSFLFDYLLWIFVIFAICIPFYEFALLSATFCVAGSLIVSFVIVVILQILKHVKELKLGETKISLWYSKHKSNITLVCILLFCFSSSVKNKILFSQERLDGFIGMQWAIFAITITMFIVWTALAIKDLKELEPKKQVESTLENELMFKLEKQRFFY